MEKQNLIIKKIVQETEDTKTFFFEREDGAKISFEAGEYINLLIDGLGKSYTISSAPSEDCFCITVKKGKDFSLKLHNLQEDDVIQYLGPFGFLTLAEIDKEDRENELVFIAAGIGITPFFSMMKEKSLNQNNEISMTLFYASRSREETIFYDAIEKLKEDDEKIEVFHFWSQENNKLSFEKITEKLDDLTNKNYFICGSIQFVDEYWKYLKNAGISEDKILTESFFMQ